MELEFEKFKYPDELPDQRRLFVECFPENIGTPVIGNEHYKWKFKSFPGLDKEQAYEYVTRLEGDMVAYYAAIPYEYLIYGRKVYAAMVCDVMTGVKARGKGVFTKLGVFATDQFKTEGLSFSTGYPIRPEVIPGHRKAGWEFPFEIPMYGKFLKMNSFLKTRGKGFLTLTANILLKLFNLFTLPSTKKNVNDSVENYTSAQLLDIVGLDSFFEKWKSEQTITLNKNVDFLKWRLGAPGKEYQILLLRVSEEVVGYSIVRNVMKENVPCLGILDYSILKNFQNKTGLLLNAIERLARTSGAELILSMMLKHDAVSNGFTKNGFLKTPYPFSFIIKQFDETIDPTLIHDETNWSLMWIDSDDL